MGRSREFCEQLKKKGTRDVEVQRALQRLSLDVIMMTAFGMDPHAVDFEECEVLDSLHYGFEEIFRCVDTCLPAKYATIPYSTSTDNFWKVVGPHGSEPGLSFIRAVSR